MGHIRLDTLNINGAQEDTKEASVFTLVNSKKTSVTFLQKTHSTLDEPDWRRGWGGQLVLSHRSSNSGVRGGVLFSRDFVPPVAGRLFKISTVFENVTLVFVNVYAQLNVFLFAWMMVYSSENGLN